MADKGDLQVKATMDSTGFNASLQSMKLNAQKFGNEVSSGLGASFAGIGRGAVGGIVGMIGLGGFISAFQGLISKASGIREVAEEMEATADSVQKMEKAIQRFDGLSMSKFQGIVSKINEARLAAFTDPKERSKFAALGISSQDILNTKGIDPMAFAGQVFAGGSGSAKQQARLAAIVGTKGTRYGPAVALSAQMTPDFNEQQLDQFHDIHLKEKQVGNWITKAWASFWGNIISAVTDPFTPGAKRFFRGSERMGIGQVGSTMVPSRSHTKEVIDPMVDILAAKRTELDERQQEAEHKLREAERQNMTIGKRRDDIMKERDELNARIAAKSKQTMTATQIEHLNPEEKMEWEAKRKLELTAMKAQRAGLTHELQQKPLDFTADSLAKVGGFTSSTIGFNPVVGIQQQQLIHLRNIDNKLVAGRDRQQ